MIKKCSLLLAALFTLVVTVVPIQQAYAAEYVWKLAHEELPGGFMDSVAHEFGKKLAEKSNGNIKLEVYPSGTLGTSEDLVELTQHNAIQFNFADAGHLGTQIPQVQALLLQYLFPSDMNVVKQVLNEGSFMELLTPKFHEKNLEPLVNLTEGWQVWSTNRPISKPSDFNDFKMRTMSSKLLVESYAAYGANPTPIPFSEVYSALQLKMVDGQENPVFAIYDMKFYEVQQNIIFGYTGPFVLTLISNKAFIDSLPEDIRAIALEAARECIAYGFNWQDKFNASRLEKMKQAKKDLNIKHLTEEEMQAFKTLAKKTHEVYFNIGGEGAKEILTALQADIKKFSK